MVEIKLTKKKNFTQGKRIKFIAQWSEVHHVEVRLSWYIRGDEERNYGTAFRKEISGSEINPWNYKFDVEAPHGPISFCGKIFELYWVVEILDADRNERSCQELTLT